MIMLDKEAREYASKVKQKDARVQAARQRQRAMGTFKIKKRESFTNKFLAKILTKEDAAAERLRKIKEKKAQERKLTKEIQTKRQKNAKIQKYFQEYQVGLRKSLTKKKYQGTYSV